jgi:hypothetical protein
MDKKTRNLGTIASNSPLRYQQQKMEYRGDLRRGASLACLMQDSATSRVQFSLSVPSTKALMLYLCKFYLICE